MSAYVWHRRTASGQLFRVKPIHECELPQGADVERGDLFLCDDCGRLWDFCADTRSWGIAEQSLILDAQLALRIYQDAAVRR